jgi:hypothetical protein
VFGIQLQRWVALAPLVVLSGIALIAQTYVHSKRAALYASVALALAIVALTFRTIDLSVCSAFPIGTHFLWHSFLSAGGALGVVALVELPITKSAGRAAEPAAEAAE